MPIFQKSVI